MNSSLSAENRRKNILSAVLAVICVIYVLPVVAVVINSFKLNTYVKTNTFDLPRGEMWAEFSNFIKGMTDNASKLAKQAEDLAGTVSSYLHFSEPEKGPLSDFNESGADMIQNFIDSMESEKYDLERAMNDTASIIGNGMSAEVAVQPFSNSVSDSGLASLEQALTSRGTEGGTWVFPIYLGGDLIDTVVVDALDRYNYQTGGH